MPERKGFPWVEVLEQLALLFASIGMAMARDPQELERWEKLLDSTRASEAPQRETGAPAPARRAETR